MNVKNADRVQRGKLLREKLFTTTLLSISVAALVGCSSHSSVNTAAAPAQKETAAADADQGSQRTLRLITAAQLENTISYIFGPGVTFTGAFAPVTRTDGLLGVGSAIAGVTSAQIETYQKTAATADAEIMSDRFRNFSVPCRPKDEQAADDACARTFLSTVGKLLYRRPLEPERLAEYVSEANEAATRLKNFYTGLGTVFEGMLISPRVLMVSERAEPDPKHPGEERLDAYSLASRLSFFLWNAGPDEQLLAAAASGELETPKGFAKTVDRMLASPRLEVGMRAFFSDMFQLDDFDNLAKDGQIYPAFTGAAVQDAREQTLRTTIDHLLVKNMDYRDLYTSRDTFISPTLATLYKLPTTPGWVEYQFPPDSPRVGLLTEIGFLAAHSHPGRSSATLRGKALREIVMCEPVPRPPPNVDFSAVENPDPKLHTARDRLTAHRKNPVCAGCHKIMDPMGLSLENFDGAGEYRETEKGAKIDASGTLDGKEFSDVIGLAAALHDNPAVTSCLVRRVYSYAVGAPSGSVEPATLEQLDKQFAANGYRLRALLRSVVTNRSFAMVHEEKAPVSTVKTASAAHSAAGAQ